MKEYISANQTAKKLCISVETVYNMLRDGRLVEDTVKVMVKKGKLAC